jgi:RecB family exonuclease
MKALDSYRQSLLANFETCPRRTRFALEGREDISAGFVEASAALGSLTHLVYAELLRTLYRTGHEQVPTQEAVEVMYEVMAASDIVLPADERESLRLFTLRFCEWRWEASRVLALEHRLEAQVVCQDDKTRTLTGAPDVLIADPPDGIIIVDYKSGWAVPKAPRKPPEDGPITGKQYLSSRGHFQLDCYGLLGLRAYPQAARATLRERHLRSGETREATLYRDDLEHIERELGVQMQKLERAICQGARSKAWKPRSGHHCLRQCPVARSCPIPAEQRGDGHIGSDAQADREAAVFAVLDAQRQQTRSGLKAYWEETGYAPKVGDGREMYKPDGKSFGMHEPEDLQLAEASAEAAERGLA